MRNALRCLALALGACCVFGAMIWLLTQLPAAGGGCSEAAGPVQSYGVAVFEAGCQLCAGHVTVYRLTIDGKPCLLAMGKNGPGGVSCDWHPASE